MFFDEDWMCVWHRSFPNLVYIIGTFYLQTPTEKTLTSNVFDLVK